MARNKSVSLDEKLCSACGKTKSLGEFWGKKIKLAYCSDCANKFARDRYARNGGKGHKNKRLKRVYGITIDQYLLMLAEQNGVCAICKQAETACNQHGLLPLAVDHDHQTGKVRGLLCKACNLLLGHLEKQGGIAFLGSALSYLEEGGNYHGTA